MIKTPSEAEGKFTAKPYTPTSLPSKRGSFEIVVKLYPGGKVSGYLHSLDEGERQLSYFYVVIVLKYPYMQYDILDR